MHSTTSRLTGPAALQLDDQRALEFQRRGEQRGRGEQLGQHPAQRRRIGMLAEDLAAGVVEAHQRAADGGALEHEARHVVGEAGRGGHGAVLISALQPGPCTASSAAPEFRSNVAPA